MMIFVSDYSVMTCSLMSNDFDIHTLTQKNWSDRLYQVIPATDIDTNFGRLRGSFWSDGCNLKC